MSEEAKPEIKVRAFTINQNSLAFVLAIIAVGAVARDAVTAWKASVIANATQQAEHAALVKAVMNGGGLQEMTNNHETRLGIIRTDLNSVMKDIVELKPKKQP